jgi:hypothetical protein
MLEMEETDNFAVHANLLEAAARMPAHTAARWADREAEWLAEQPVIFGLVPDRSAALVNHLADGGEPGAAVSLADAFLRLSSGPEQDDEDSALGDDKRTHGRCDDWEYQQFVAGVTQTLAATDWRAALELFGRTLDCALETSYRSDDYSYVWRSAIEAHPQNSDHGVEGSLVSAVRDVAVEAANNYPIADVLNELRRFERPTFRRIELHIIRTAAPAGAAVVESALNDRANFDDHRLHHEYALLLRDRFSECSKGSQLRILDWIITEPDVEYYRERFLSEKQREPGEDDLERWKKNVWVRRMAPFSDSLPPEWRRKFDEWVADVGEPRYPDLLTYGESWIGPTSPLAAAEVIEWGPARLVDFVASWTPASDWNSPTHDGLAREVSQAIEDAPAVFAADALRLAALPPAYHNWVLHGFAEAAKKGLGSHAGDILELAHSYLVKAERTPADEARSTRLAVTRFAQAVMRPTATLDVRHREAVWQLIDPLRTDPDPTSERGGMGNMDPLTESLNTVRPGALHAAIEYGLWVHRTSGAGLTELPELRAMLEDRMLRDVSPAVSAVLGQRFPWLVLLDKSWATAAAPIIFPEEDDRRLAASWGAYLVSSPPYDSVFEVLRTRYERATDDLPGEEPSGDTFWFGENPDQRLAEHLLILYWRGVVSLAKGDLLARFFDQAPESLRAHAIEFVGRSLRDTPEGALADDINRRLIDLFEWRLDAARAEGADTFTRELRAFGWWAMSDALDGDWILARLAEVLRIVGGVDAEHVVAARLAGMSSVHPRQTVEVMTDLVNSLAEPLRIHGFVADVRATLQNALASNDSEARRIATELVHRLGGLGFVELRSLLPSR